MKKKIAQKELIKATNIIFDNFKSTNQNETKKPLRDKPLLLTKKVKIISNKKVIKKIKKTKKVISKNDVLLLNNILKYKPDDKKVLFLENIVGKNIKFTFLKKSAWESKK
tara:strand:- start:78458 stop:78787 length:330 start_codon:yes stop_codon:yes gene_type:complete